MAESARRWADAVLPRVAVRQWVVTVPWPRRWLLARRSDLARGVLGVAIAEIQRWTARHGVQPARPGGQTGSVTVIQRFGGALNLNLHFHILVLDGQYAADPRTGVLRWVRARPPTTEEVERLVERVADRAEAWLARRGFRGDFGLGAGPGRCPGGDTGRSRDGALRPSSRSKGSAHPGAGWATACASAALRYR